MKAEAVTDIVTDPADDLFSSMPGKVVVFKIQGHGLYKVHSRNLDLHSPKNPLQIWARQPFKRSLPVQNILIMKVSPCQPDAQEAHPWRREGLFCGLPHPAKRSKHQSLCAAHSTNITGTLLISAAAIATVETDVPLTVCIAGVISRRPVDCRFHFQQLFTLRIIQSLQFIFGWQPPVGMTTQ